HPADPPGPGAAGRPRRPLHAGLRRRLQRRPDRRAGRLPAPALQHQAGVARREDGGGRRPPAGDRAVTVRFTLNGRPQTTTADPSTPLLYVLRDDFQLNGAKYGCGLGQCGSCTVALDDRAVFSCVTPLAAVEGRQVTTVEGLGTAAAPGKLQAAFR